MRKARDGLKVEYTGVNLKHLQTQPPGKVITGGSPPVRISQASVQRNLFMPSNQESTSVVDCITMPCLIQNVPARGWMKVLFFGFFFKSQRLVGTGLHAASEKTKTSTTVFPWAMPVVTVPSTISTTVAFPDLLQVCLTHPTHINFSWRVFHLLICRTLLWGRIEWAPGV